MLLCNVFRKFTQGGPGDELQSTSRLTGGRARTAMPAEVTAPSLLRQLGQLAAPTASSPSNKGSKLKRQRVGDGGAAGFLRELGQLITKISATGVTVEELAPPLRLVVALATLSNVSSWWPASSAQTFEGPLDAARRLLSALLPVTGPLDFFDHTAVLLGAFGQLGAFRAEAMHWLVLAHEALGCWYALHPGRTALLYHLRDPQLTADAGFALFRIGSCCAARRGGAGGAWLERHHLKMVYAVLRERERTQLPPLWVLRAILTHQLPKLTDPNDARLTGVFSMSPYHELACVDYVAADELTALIACMRNDTFTTAADRQWRERREAAANLRGTGGTHAHAALAAQKQQAAAALARASDTGAADGNANGNGLAGSAVPGVFGPLVCERFLSERLSSLEAALWCAECR